MCGPHARQTYRSERPLLRNHVKFAAMAATTPLSHADIDRLWVDAASRCGFRVERGDAAYASTDGRGTILVGSPHTLDADDSLCQLILHELCHALVQGRQSWTEVDWGLCNTDDRDDVAEQACLRLQAHLATPHGLRRQLRPTTSWQGYYEALPPDPLLPADPVDQDACERARRGASLAEDCGLAGVLHGALAETATLLARIGHNAPAAKHPTGFAPGPPGETCGSCAWRYVGGRGGPVERCRQSAPESGDGVRISASLSACERWEPPVECARCGACCREAYHTVAVSVRDPVVWKRPALIVRTGHRFSLLRAGDRCAALQGQGDHYHCDIYEDRPRTCRDFERGGRHCLVARRRVGLSR
jgi:hypothetical protein